MTLEQRKLELITWIAGLANEEDLSKIELVKSNISKSIVSYTIDGQGVDQAFYNKEINEARVQYKNGDTFSEEEILNFLEESSKNESDTLVLHTSVQDILDKNID